MPKQKYVENVFTQCPYYKGECKAVARCEGENYHCIIHRTYDSPSQRKAFEEEFCRSVENWKKCIIAQIHNRKWDYEA